MAPRTSRSMAGLTTDEVIKCLKDGSRDMTQVIYRQIPEMDIFDINSGNLRGESLYRINYCGDAFCHAIGSGKGRYYYGSDTQNWVGHQPTHDHLIWCQGDDDLFRCRVAFKCPDWAMTVAGSKVTLATWAKGQKEIMARPQLYLTVLRR